MKFLFIFLQKNVISCLVKLIRGEYKDDRCQLVTKRNIILPRNDLKIKMGLNLYHIKALLCYLFFIQLSKHTEHSRPKIKEFALITSHEEKCVANTSFVISRS